MTQENGEVERIARAFHAAKAEIGHGVDNRTPWVRLPTQDRELLKATVRLMLKWDVIRPGRRRGP